jgi:type IV secretory pathway VirB2 component (pilin)
MKKFLKYISIVPSFLFVTPVFAEDPPSFGSAGGSLASMVDTILGYLFPLAGLICLIFIIQGGYMWMVSAGDPARVKQAQGTLTWAILGFIFVMVILALLQGVIEFAR